MKSNFFLLVSVVIFFVFFKSTNAQENKVTEVALNVNVEDSYGRTIDGLTSENFRVYEDGKLREIRTVKSENTALSVGFLVDLSDSMTKNFRNNKISRVDWGRQSMLDFLQDSNESNEYFLILFGKESKIVSDFNNRDEVVKVIKENSNFDAHKQSKTKLYDAIVMALKQMTKAKNKRQVLYVLSDGQDNQSDYKLKELQSLVKQNNIIIYFVAVYDPTDADSYYANINSQLIIEKLTGITGGYGFFPRGLKEVRESAVRISTALKSQYTINFESNVSDEINKWRIVKVKLEVPKERKKEFDSIRVRHREGYFPASKSVEN